MKKIILSLLAIIVLIEEFLWQALTFLSAKLAKFLRLEKFESWLSQTSPYIAMLAFVIPILLVLPINLFAFWLMAIGCIVRGVILEIFAKLLGTFLIARVFALTKQQLMTFIWFKKLYNTIIKWIDWAHDVVRNTKIYQLTKEIKIKIKNLINRH